ncbi:hypothetical protein C8R45DRAFT_1147891, partial [Mycena sanguinolenta]
SGSQENPTKPRSIRRAKARSIRSHPYAQNVPALAPPQRTMIQTVQRTRAQHKQPTQTVHGNPGGVQDFEWDGWPDGNFTSTFPLDFVEAHDNLRIHWACEILGGTTGGSVHSETWKDGKITRRKCQGIIECTSSTCNILVRPQTRTAGIHKQLSKACSCGGALIHHPCGVVSTLHTYKHGVRYDNGGDHLHARPTVRLHMSKKENNEFSKIVEHNPTAGPLKLLVGPPGINGPGASVANITPLLSNAERIRYERRKILKGTRRQENFTKEFEKFQAQHPDFIREAQFGEVTVIVMQTPFMASKLIKVVTGEEAINGIVSDAAHRFWLEKNGLLIVSSTFTLNCNTDLKCWVPGIMSYANGGTAEHYRIHFYHLFLGMASECDRRQIEVTDDMFANVVDFSTAERNGFILAFVDFWLDRAPGERSIDELLETAPKLLKGCEQHFRSQITRVKKISGVVDPSKTDIFENKAKGLLRCTNMDEFTCLANDFIAAFPRAENWIRWWMLPAHATMLFPAFRIMNPELWKSIPDTTNPEEAMHWKIYCSISTYAAIGTAMSLLDGLRALHKFAEHYQHLFDASSHGVKIFYGQDRQHWKSTAEKLGYTKPSRRRTARLTSARTKNDGRPPDTSKALMRANKTEYQKSYRWKDNSMKPMFDGLPPNHILRDLHQMIYTRLESVPIAGYEPGGCTLLNNQRDGFRQVLRTVPGLKAESMSAFNTMFGWLYRITDQRRTAFEPAIERAGSYFRLTSVMLKSCSGSVNDHWQLSHVKVRNELQLTYELCEKYGGDMRKWFQELVRVNRSESNEACWQSYEGQLLCFGNARQNEVILNIPVVLVVEMGEMLASEWNIPGSFLPYAASPTATAKRLKYNIVGHIYASIDAAHFIVRYLSVSGSKKKIFDYDGQKHEGHAIRNRGTTMRGTLTGPSLSIDVPDGYELYALVYHLEGGEDAQQFFRKEQVKQAKKIGLHFNIVDASQTGIPSACEIQRQGVQRISDDDRFWLITPSSTTTDYISTTENRGRKTTSWHAPMMLPTAHQSPPSNVDVSPTLEANSRDSHLGSDDDIDEMIINTITLSPAKPRQPKLRFSSTPDHAGSQENRPVSPSPVWCDGCGDQAPDGDDDPDEVQCEHCKYWSHARCLREEDWNDPEVHFVCRRCLAKEKLEFFRWHEIVMVPDPNVP